MTKTHDVICRACSVEHRIKRGYRWVAVGLCPYCEEHHTLFEAQVPNPSSAPISSDGISRAVNPYILKAEDYK